MAQIFKGRVYSGAPYPSAEINYEYTRDGANMKYRFTGKVYLEQSGGWYYNNLQLKLYLNGSNVYTKDCKSSATGWSIDFDSGWKTVENKTSGTTPFYFTVKDTQNSSWCNYTSSTYKLTVAPAYFSTTPTLELVSKTETSVTLKWTTSENASESYYKITDWVQVEKDIDKKTGTITITGLSPNTEYTIYGDFKRKDSGLWCPTKPSIKVTTYNYPYCTKTPNFVIGNPLSLEFYNPLGRNITVYLIGADSKRRGGDTTTGTTISCTYNSNAWQEFLYSTIPNTKSSKYQIEVTYASSVITKSYNNTYSIDDSKCLPTFTNFTYKDTNSTVTGVTGNNQVLVKGLSSLEVTISSANKMVAVNGASPKNYNITIDTLNKTVDYSTSDIVTNVGTVVSSGTKRLNVKANDSRTLSKTVYKDITVYDYSKPVINASVTRLNNFENETTLKVNGTYTRLTIGGTDKNTVTKVQYRYRETGGTWSNWTTLNTTVTAGKFTCTDAILSLDNNKSFDFEVQVVDKLTTNTNTGNVGVGQAIFFISTNKRECYINGRKIPTSVDGNASKNLFNMLDSSHFVFREKTNIYQSFKLSSFSSNEIKVTGGNGNYTEGFIDVSGLEPNTQYCISYTIKENTLGFNPKMSINGNSSSTGTLTINMGLSNGSTTVSSSNYVIFSNIQLEKGTTPTSYEPCYDPTLSVSDSNGNYHNVPYTKGTMSKNLYNYNNVDTTRIISSSDGSFSTSDNNYAFCGYIRVEPNTTYSRSDIGTSNNTFLDKNKRFISSAGGQTFTTPSNCYYVGFNMTIAKYNDGSYKNFMVNKGSKLLDYEDYFEPTLSIRDTTGTFHKIIDINDINKEYYSKNEQIIGTWIDGKPIYRRVVTNTARKEVGSFSIAHNISNIDTVTKVSGIQYYTAKEHYPFPLYYNNTAKISYIKDVDDTNINIYFGDTWVGTTYIIVEYTKTTD